MTEKSNVESLTEDELLALAAGMPHLLFESAEGRHYRDRLKTLVEDHRARVAKDRDLRLQYVLTLVLRCPPFLEKQVGFEWVAEEFRQALRMRSCSQVYNKRFWEALECVRGKLNKGRPRSLGRSLRLANKVLVLEGKGMNRSQAVKQVVEEESARSEDGTGPSEREVYRGLKRAEKEACWELSPGPMPEAVLEELAKQDPPLGSRRTGDKDTL